MSARAKVQPRKSAGVQGRARPVRAPWGTMSRARVVEAAMSVVSEGGYDNMTIRGLASRLGVAPMSLYRHVKDKGDLMDEVVDRMLQGTWQPRASRSNWRAWTEEAAERFRAFLVSQPAALAVYLSHPVVAPASIERMETMMAVLRGAGFDDAVAKRAYAAVHTYTLGFAALESSRANWAPPPGQGTALVKQLVGYTTPRQFSDGLAYLLDGIAPSGGEQKREPKKARHKK